MQKTCLVLAALAGCAGTTSSGDDDVTPEADADVNVIDARPQEPPADADPFRPDADPSQPDAGPKIDAGEDTDDLDNLPMCDFMKPSFRPPGGLDPQDIPLFVVLGIDDNRYADGMKWVLDELEDRKNPAGRGNPRTYDGKPLRTTFYMLSSVIEVNDAAIFAQWQRAVAGKHEIGNHTKTHEVADWNQEISACNDTLVSRLGIQEKDIVGFRAPYLNYQQPTLVYPVLQGFDNIKYDCTIRHDAYYDYLTPGPIDVFVHIWPYTLDNGIDIYTGGNLGIGNYPGLWELPTYALPRSPNRASLAQPSQNYTGFDSTAYGTLNISAQDFSNSMKWALDLRLEDVDNRAPLLIGLHSDTYSTQNMGYSQPLDQRKKAVTDFLDYALSKPEVRFVSAKQLIQWMCDPKPL